MIKLLKSNFITLKLGYIPHAILDSCEHYEVSTTLSLSSSATRNFDIINFLHNGDSTSYISTLGSLSLQILTPPHAHHKPYCPSTLVWGKMHYISHMWKGFIRRFSRRGTTQPLLTKLLTLSKHHTILSIECRFIKNWIGKTMYSNDTHHFKNSCHT